MRYVYVALAKPSYPIGYTTTLGVFTSEEDAWKCIEDNAKKYGYYDGQVNEEAFWEEGEYEM